MLVASTHSKAVLRSAVADTLGVLKNLHFPSYEIITHNKKGDWRFDDNLRTVSAKGVEPLCDIFCEKLAFSQVMILKLVRRAKT